MKNKGINYLLVQAAKDLTDPSKYSVRYNERTNSGIHELQDYVMFGNPNYRILNLEDRKNNLCAQIVEMMMVLSGNPDLKYLSMFLPRAVEYSDDGGKTWRGNYGIRLRGRNVFKGENSDSFQFVKFNKDNVEKVIDTLNSDLSSRQCFITVGDSNLDRFINTKDTPCTMTLVFGTDVENKLRLTTFMRSNDVIFGFSGVNYFIFTCLQELVASIVGLELGEYCHHAVSFHVYDVKFDTIDKLSKIDIDSIEEIELKQGLFNGFTELSQFDDLAKVYFDILDSVNDISLNEAYQLLGRCKNNNLRAMLLGTISYLKESSLADFQSVISTTEVKQLQLFEKNSFFTKKVKNV